jgi:hypothetical protein
VSNQETESRFGDKALDVDSAGPGDIAYFNGDTPAMVISVNRAEDSDDVSVTYFPLTNVETAHADDFAQENMDDSGVTPRGLTTTGAPPTGPAPAPVIPATQPAPDDPSRATTPTGATVGGGTAGATGGAAQAASEGAVTSTNPPPGEQPVLADESNLGNETRPTDQGAAREQSQEDRIATLEQRLAAAEARADRAEQAGAPADENATVPPLTDVRPDGDEGAGPSGSAPASL